jgi:hypothetical protein
MFFGIIKFFLIYLKPYLFKNIIDNKNLELHEFEKLVNHRNLYGEYLKKLQKNNKQ